MTASIAKVLWVVENEPEIATHAHKFVDVHAFLVRRLTGAFRTSLANADPMGLVDIAGRYWAQNSSRRLASASTSSLNW